LWLASRRGCSDEFAGAAATGTIDLSEAVETLAGLGQIGEEAIWVRAGARWVEGQGQVDILVAGAATSAAAGTTLPDCLE